MYGEPSVTCMTYGITCDDGWYDLIYNLCEELQSISDKIGKQLVATQIKEKFGTLRFYLKVVGDNLTDEEWESVLKTTRKYEKLSSETCELTGGFGKLHKRGYIYKTLCKESALLFGYEVV